MKPYRWLTLFAILLGGCASYDGGGLVPGQSTGADAEALMGAPTERVKAGDGDTILFYSRQPFGRQMYAVRVAPDGRVRSVQQTLTEENMRNAVPGVTTKAQVREIFGPPYQTAYFPRQQREVWTYTMLDVAHADYYLHVQMSDDGILREVLMIKDYNKELGGPKD